ncbi:hypothetical protein [Caenispirillum bisanense]|uniref:hypothetical protein n=1 Tax=Caenispirillum bisanense TaxID=414052 RepID=UPI0031DAB05D
MAQPPRGDIEGGQERDLIDQGRLGDKIAQHDPAAAPLHTDNEAAGDRVSRSAAMAMAEGQAATAGSAQQGQDHYGSRDQPQRRTPGRGGLMWAIILIVLAVTGLVLGFGF